MYVWQMNDGRWHVSHYTPVKFDLRMRELHSGFETRAEAEKALAAWLKRYPDAVQREY